MDEQKKPDAGNVVDDTIQWALFPAPLALLLWLIAWMFGIV